MSKISGQIRKDARPQKLRLRRAHRKWACQNLRPARLQSAIKNEKGVISYIIDLHLRENTKYRFTQSVYITFFVKFV